MNRIFLGAIVVSMMIVLSACQGKEPDQLEEDLRTSLDALISGENSQESYIYDADLWGSLQDESTKLTQIRKRVDYEIADIEEGRAQVLFEAPDVMSIMESAVNSEVGDVQELLAAVEESLQGDYPVKEFQVECEMKLIDGHWYFLLNDDLNNALTGGLMEAYTEYVRKWIDGQGGGQS